MQSLHLTYHILPLMNNMKFVCHSTISLLVLTSSPIVSALSFDRSTDANGNDFADLVFKNRVFVPYGPDLTTTPPQRSTGEVWEGFGFGMGAAEHIAYDPIQGYMYIQSEEGPFVNVIDYSSLPPKLTSFSLDLAEFDSEIKDLGICPEQGLLFVVLPDNDRVNMYTTVKRSDPEAAPELLFQIDAGPVPDNIRVNRACTIMAVANENDGAAFAEGAIHLVSNFQANGGPTVKRVSLAGFDDDYLLAREVHMPLTNKSMEYWDDFSDLRDEIDWSVIRAQYNPAFFFAPEFMQFSHDSSQLYVNLQKNSAFLRIDVATAEAKVIDGYGLKSWSDNGIDILKDGGCDMYAASPVLYTTRASDGIDTVEIDGVAYVVTADEGTDADFGAYEEKIDAGDLFFGTTLTPRNFVAPDSFFSTASSPQGASARFNSECEDNGIFLWCADDFSISLASSAVDYSDPSAPVISKIVGFGGRGISIFRIPESYEEPIEFVWDSGSDFEAEGCAAYPWAHNGVQDEDFAPIDGTRYELLPEERDGLDDANDPTQDGCDDAGNGASGACPISETIDEKAPEDGLAPESVTIAIACERVLTISCGENNGDCFLYDITNIVDGSDPVLKKVFNLSPASELKSPGVAYDDRTLGELDAEATFFVSAAESPTGKAGIFFGGAHSGTVSFWEFECTNPVQAVDRLFIGAKVGEASTGNGSDDGLSGGAIAGIVIGVLVIASLLAMVVFKMRGSGSDIETDTAKMDAAGGV